TAWRTSHVRNPFALLEIMNIGLASFSRSIYATTPMRGITVIARNLEVATIRECGMGKRHGNRCNGGEF
ncbi:hypothetical protein, partial [Burkholderia ambifaria]|uniref:hypothetical protein n=1 Tax=Burkholderia ambifaria TaxID=152480 RepID=UPI001ABB3A28